jgi:hypothetical protein
MRIQVKVSRLQFCFLPRRRREIRPSRLARSESSTRKTGLDA